MCYKKDYQGRNVWAFRPSAETARYSDLQQFQVLYQALRQAELKGKIRINDVNPSYGSEPKDFVMVEDLSGYCALI